MRRLRQIISGSSFLALIFVFTFAASQAQNSHNRNLQYRQGYQQILMGKVVNARTNQPVSDAEVTIMTSGINADSANNIPNYGMRAEATVTTDQDGTFLVKNLSPGPHTIKVQKENYNYWQNTVRMSMRMNNYRRYNGLSAYGYYRHGYRYPYSYGYRHNNNERQPPFRGFFRPDSEANGFFHGVFSANNSNHNNPAADHPSHHRYGANSYSKGLFLIIRLQKNNK